MNETRLEAFSDGGTRPAFERGRLVDGAPCCAGAGTAVAVANI
ncbi:MAG TPA: hypothetical protein VNU46_02205 [Gemmatimonadaceae bacterium]|nr:hypothetical protein [Gemmatimonadaceae bacterium]